MRIKLECILLENSVTADYHRKILSFFKKSLENYDLKIKEIYYDEPLEKDMSFACYLPIEKIEGDIIFLKSSNFTIYLTFNSVIDGIHYYNAFFNGKKKNMSFNLGEGNSFKVVRIKKVNEKDIKSEVAIFQTMSPIVIREKREGEKDWYHILDEKGIDVLKHNLKYNLRNKFSEDMIMGLEFKPIDMQKTVVSFYGLKFPATRGILAIKGDVKILNYLYKSGLGSRKSSGFGMLELIK